jgi:CBS domain-containing protein
MSPRAACRLDALGFSEVYDYMPGKADWLARGLPTEGEEAGAPRALGLVVDDVVTCGLDERVSEVRERVEASRYRFAFVVSNNRVVLGRLRRAAFEGDGEVTAGTVMEPGPSTIRPDTGLEPLAERMRKNELSCLPVTTPEGELLGLVRRDDLEAGLTSGQP